VVRTFVALSLAMKARGALRLTTAHGAGFFQPFYRRLCLSQPTISIGVAMMKLPRVRTEAQNKKCCVTLLK